MPKRSSPRHGSMAYWPRKRAISPYTRIRTWTETGEVKPLGFAGYKAGMTHIMITDSKKTSLTKGQDISYSVTVVECPPIKVAGIRFYKILDGRKIVSTEIISSKVDKELTRKMILPKRKENEKKIEEIEKNLDSLSDIRLLAYTQPKLTGIGKKKPELFELAIGGEMKNKIEYAKQILGKEINVKDVLKEGVQVDVHAVSKGKGFQGPVKRFGVAIRQHKSEKTKRGPGALGPWHPHHGVFTVAHAGQMGYHSRYERNKQIMRISNDAKQINPTSGFLHYGIVKNDYILLKGSVPGTTKRLVKFTFAQRKNKRAPDELGQIQYVSLKSKQGN